MTRTEIRDLLGRNRPGAAVDEALPTSEGPVSDLASGVVRMLLRY